MTPASSISVQSFSFTNISFLFVVTLPFASLCNTSEALIMPSLSPLNFKMSAGMALHSEACCQKSSRRYTTCNSGLPLCPTQGRVLNKTPSTAVPPCGLTLPMSLRG